MAGNVVDQNTLTQSNKLHRNIDGEKLVVCWDRKQILHKHY